MLEDMLKRAAKGLLMAMELWEETQSGQRLFIYGREDYAKAAQAARLCAGFKDDDEDEVVSDEDRSCYNCRYRRWTRDSFECLKA